MFPKKVALHDENGLRKTAEEAFISTRKSIVCPVCLRENSIHLDCASGRRRFKCSCKKTWSCRGILDLILPGNDLARTRTHPNPSAGPEAAPPGEAFTENHMELLAGNVANEGNNRVLLDESSGATSLSTVVPVPEAVCIPTFKSRKGNTISERLEERSMMLRAISKLEKRFEKIEEKLLQLGTTRPEYPLSPPCDSPLSENAIGPEYDQLLLKESSRVANWVKKPSFSEMAKRLKISPNQEKMAIESLAVLHRKKTPIINATEIDKKHHVRRLYVSNLPRLRISELKRHLFRLRFSLTKIWNISYVGKNIVEFTIMEDYENAMTSLLKKVNLKLLEDYNPLGANDPNATEDTQKIVFNAVKSRLANLSIQKPHSKLSSFYADWLESIDVLQTSLSNSNVTVCSNEAIDGQELPENAVNVYMDTATDPGNNVA